MATKDAKDVLKNLDAESKNLIKLLIFGIKKFYGQDAEALFGHGDCPMHIDERAMVGCIYRYAWCCIKQKGLDYDIDIEYDRMYGRNEGLVKKSIDLATECGTDSCRRECLLLIKNMIEKKWKRKNRLYSIRPDLIIHKRNSSVGQDNYLVVEFKKVPVDKSDDKFDRAKIRWNCCRSSLLRYKVGLIVRLGEKEAQIEQCDNQGVFSQIGFVDKVGFYASNG